MMTTQQFIAALETHGSNPQDWPASSRAAMEKLLATDPAATLALREFQEMDNLLGQLSAPEFPGLAQRIANQPLPEKDQDWLQAAINWLLPDGGLNMFWRPALLACLPLFVGIAVGSNFNFGISSQNQTLEYWEDELAMISLTDYSQNQIEL